MAIQLRYTPANESTLVTLDVSNVFGGLKRLRVDAVTDRATMISVGGKARTIVYDAWHVIDVDTIPVTRSSDVDGWAAAMAFVSHANRGGEFAFAYDSTSAAATTLNGALTQGNTTVTLTSTSGFANDDIVFIEDANDPTKHEVNQINVAATTTIRNGVLYSYADDSTFRHHEYWPALICTNEATLRERDAGRGASLFDLSFSARTVR